jgi:hypothetical protein
MMREGERETETERFIETSTERDRENEMHRGRDKWRQR